MTIESKLSSVESTLGGFANLSRLHAELAGHHREDIILDFAACHWFSANMSAPLGIVLDSISSNNTVKIGKIQQKTENILSRNGFLCGFGYEKKHDSYGTTIPFTKFENDEAVEFAEFIRDHLDLKEMPDMSDKLRQRFLQSISEIFANSASHSESDGPIYVCGQFFPNKHCLDISLADAGIGIRRKIAKELGIKLNSDKAIEWALQEGNTTKKGTVPGGLGLKLLQQFIGLNKGRLQIVSDRGYWELAGAGETLTRMEHSFPGTVVNIEINTADESSYSLSTEA